MQTLNTHCLGGPGAPPRDAGHRRRIDFGIEGFNVFNRANYLRPPTDYYTLTNVPGGISRLDGPLASFGKPNDATRSRELQAVIRFQF